MQKIYCNFSATPVSVNQYGNTYCLLYPNGEVLWVPPAQFAAVCAFNLKYWPFDSQTCKFIFGSWTHHGDLIALEIRDVKPVEVQMYF